MHIKRIYILLLPIIACLVFSCTSETPDPASGKGAQLIFSISNPSRATVVSNLNTAGSKFVVFGDRKISDDPDENPVVFLNNTTVEYFDGNWQYNNLQYWIPNQEHSFVAVYPVSIVGSDYNPQYTKSALSFTYTLPTSSANEIANNEVLDILGATHRRFYQKGDGLPVSLRFNHLMTLINISPGFNDNIMDAESYIRFHKVEFTGVRNKATFKITPAQRLSASQTDDRLIEITAHAGEAKMTIEFSEPKKITNHAENQSLFDANDAIIMLPQIFAAESDAQIILTYTVNDNPEMMTLCAPLSLLEWKSGKSYNYKFTLDRTGLISNSTTITDWEVTNVGNIDMQ